MKKTLAERRREVRTIAQLVFYTSTKAIINGLERVKGR